MLIRQRSRPKAFTPMRLIFIAAMAGALAVAVSPAAAAGGPEHRDKLLHLAAFYFLSLIACLAFPRMSLLVVGAAMAVYGAMIELIQGIPYVDRDMEFLDWVADAVGVAIAVVPMALASLRRVEMQSVTRLPSLRR
jgi:VanZ family protein